MNILIKTSWANAIINPDFICIETYSGYRGRQWDPKGSQHFSDLDASNAELGGMILDALSHSRVVLPKPRNDVWIHPEVTFDPEFYDSAVMAEAYSDWVANLIKKFSYKNKNVLFKDMNNCDINCRQGKITFVPTNHDRLDGWSGDGLTEADSVILPVDSSPAEIGAALRLAFSRCIG